MFDLPFQIFSAIASLFWAQPFFFFVALIVGVGVGGFLLKQPPRIVRNWRDLEAIKEEYDPLVALLKEQKKNSYIGQIESIVDNLIAARAKTEKIKLALKAGNVNSVNSGPLSDQAKISMSNIRNFISNYEKQKSDAVLLFQNLRIKLLDTSSNEVEISKIMQQVDNITFIAENIDSEDPFSNRGTGGS